MPASTICPLKKAIVNYKRAINSYLRLMIEQLVRENFPELTEATLLQEIVEHGRISKVQREEKIMDIGSQIKYMPLIIEGSIKILRQDNQGRELFLYYLQPGETCAMSLTCCMASEKSSIRAIAEEDTEMIMLPVEFMDSWTSHYPSWKNFVMTTYRRRFEELLHTIDGIAFNKMDQRLWNYLLDKSSANNSTTIETTHQQIAYELNSTREVISRLLKKLENDRKIKLGRNRIEVLN